MRYRELVEHNIGDFKPLPINHFNNKFNNSKMVYTISRNNIQHDLYEYCYDDFNKLFFTKTSHSDNFVLNNQVSSYVIVSLNNFSKWQVKSVNTYDGWKNLGISTDVYYWLIRGEFGCLVSDTQLSTDSVKLWKRVSTLPNIDFKIYDFELDKIYPMEDVGSLTTDGVEIIDHEKHTDYDNLSGFSTLRFFWVLLSGKMLKESLMLNQSFDDYKNGASLKNVWEIAPQLPNFGQIGDC